MRNSPTRHSDRNECVLYRPEEGLLSRGLGVQAERRMLVEDRGEASKGNLELAKGDNLRVQFGSQRDELSMVNEP
jgi:hypothetical protein